MQIEETGEDSRQDTHVPAPEKRNAARSLKAVRVVVFVVTLVVALAILFPVLAYVKQQAFKISCATNLTEIGMSMLLYANDYDGDFPHSGGPDGNWGMRIPNWKAQDRSSAYGLTAEGTSGVGTISSCFYLLVKYDYLTPKTLLCKGDSGTSVFNAANYGAGDKALVDLWDFGISPGEHCSYSYHQPFSLYSLTSSSKPGMAIAADRNPFILGPMTDPKNISLFDPKGGREATRMGNAWQHQNDGQNVLSVDTHVSFEKVPYCGIDGDNIYTFWDGGDIRRGAPPTLGSQPMDRVDSLLVHNGR